MLNPSQTNPLQNNPLNLGNIITSINEHIDKCKDKMKYHTKTSQNCERWGNSLSILGLTLSAGLALTLTLMTVNRSENYEVTIAGGIFAFFITINQKISNSFNFQYLQAKHNQAMDDYIELHYLFNSLVTDIERQEFEIKEYNSIINKYIAVAQKSHIPGVKACFFYCLCFK